ncbi:hypothetical protein GCM10007874_65630 [Labrys miyagiensis]|uniref:GYD domain-containing protein n=1 Tax=Labrys miyagiensis TaxID=346912 RepID=A0ABQ6CVB3_9HYPH|nr:GYD domain-containing protein [Labrys miyagiensis]GLS23542.1 hypothetical protein GCM10007874_65630 [Labrys miyagiensis]
MAYFVTLVHFTDQGARAVKDTVKRAEAFRAMAEKSGVKIHTLLWTLGQYDLVIVAEAGDNPAVVALNLSVAALGNIRSQTLTAFDANQMKDIIAKMV